MRLFNPTWVFRICILGMTIGSYGGSLRGQQAPHDPIPDMTLSPNHQYGVTVPKYDVDTALDASDPNAPRNKVVEIKTGAILGTIQGDVAYDGVNHEDVLPPWWSGDSRRMLWRVDGKWGFDAEILIELGEGKIQSQIDVLSLLQQEILKRTRNAVPEKYAVIKEKSKGDGGWFKDGFGIDCVVLNDTGAMKFPLLFRIFLTSNVKSVKGEMRFDSRMTAEVNQDGTIKVLDFHLGDIPPARYFIRPSQLPKQDTDS